MPIMSTLLSFVAAMPGLLAPKAEPAIPVMPEFKNPPKDRLDVRPVCWSMRNHPQDWQFTEFTLRHRPSGHDFWIASGFSYYRLYEARCSCMSVGNGRFSVRQKLMFHRAMRTLQKLQRETPSDIKARERKRIADINAHFMTHFTGQKEEAPSPLLFRPSTAVMGMTLPISNVGRVTGPSQSMRDDLTYRVVNFMPPMTQTITSDVNQVT